MSINFMNGLGQIMTLNPSMLTDTLARGTAVTLQASNDITLNAGINVSGSTGGAFTLQAGRNITLNSTINTANGNFTAIAGASGAYTHDREAGTPTLTLGSGATINTGTGKVVLAAINGNFVNASGSTAPITAAQWLVYSTNLLAVWIRRLINITHKTIQVLLPATLAQVTGFCIASQILH